MVLQSSTTGLMERKPNPETLETAVHIRIPEPLLKEIEKTAASETRTLSNMIRVLLQEALQQRKGGKAK